MKKTSVKLATALLIGFMLAPQMASASVFTWVKVGKWRAKVMDAGSYSETMGTNVGRYYLGRDFFGRYELRCYGTRLGTRDWTDAAGIDHDYGLAGSPYGSSNEIDNQFEVPFSDGKYLKTYFRYRPPKVVVDGTEVSDPFPKPGQVEVVAPELIPGTADVMVESHIRTKLGVDIHQKVLAWSVENHDDYVIFDWTFYNTGNTDRDDVIELPNQILKDFYIMRQFQYFPNSGSKEWTTWTGMVEDDSVRIIYAYPEDSDGKPPDKFGDPRSEGYLRSTNFAGDAVLHVDHTDGTHADEWRQPQMIGVHHPDVLALKHESGMRSDLDHKLVYEIMETGFGERTDHQEGTSTYYMHTDAAYEGLVDPTLHIDMPYDELGWIHSLEAEWATWHSTTHYSMGPYQFAFGDSIRFVWAQVGASISLEKMMAVGKAHRAKTPAAEWPEDIRWTGDWYLPPPHIDHPEIMEGDYDQAKDSWVYTGKDSLFMNAYNAQWNQRQYYVVPTAPWAPDVTVTSMPDMVRIEWDGAQSELADDFAGYKVYRTKGSSDSTFYSIFECGPGTANPAVVYKHDDITAERGKAYYYYVAAFDNGTDNIADVRNTGAILESGRFMNQTTQKATSTKLAATSLDNIRVVPNPFNITARDLQFPGEQDLIMFMELPPICTIKIYSESGDLVKTIEHTNLSADEPWGVLSEEQSVTETGQVVVSGIYIAYIETPDGESTFVKFVIIR